MTQRLAIPTLAAYGALGLPSAVLLLPLHIYIPAFYAEDLGLGYQAVGAVLLAARLWDVVTDPLVGILSDRTSSRLGARKPWVLAATPLLMLGAWGLFVPGSDAGVLSLLGWTLLIYLAGTMLILPTLAWGAELSPDYDERNTVTAWREGFVVAGTLLAAGLPALLGRDRDDALFLIAISLILVLPVCVGLATSLVPDVRRARAKAFALGREVRSVVRNKPFLRLVAAYLLNGVANGLPAGLFLIFVDRVLGAPDLSGPLLLTYFLCGVLALPFWLRLSTRIGKHRTWVVAMVWASLVFAFVPLLGAGDVWAFALICVLTGASLGADLALPSSMQADIVDLDRLRTGENRTGTYFALWTMATKVSLALSIGIAFPLLDLAGLDPQADTQTPNALLAVAALYALVPAALKLAACAVMWGHPITAARQARIRRAIERREGRQDSEPAPA